MKNLNAPKWAPRAVATEQGWKDSKTGELLVSFRGLKSLIEKNKPEISESLDSSILEIEEIKNFSDQSIEVGIVVEKESVIEEKKPVKNRAKKTQNGA